MLFTVEIDDASASLLFDEVADNNGYSGEDKQAFTVDFMRSYLQGQINNRKQKLAIETARQQALASLVLAQDVTLTLGEPTP